jgi:hypothetical protein
MSLILFSSWRWRVRLWSRRLIFYLGLRSWSDRRESFCSRAKSDIICITKNTRHRNRKKVASAKKIRNVRTKNGEYNSDRFGRRIPREKALQRSGDQLLESIISFNKENTNIF